MKNQKRHIPNIIYTLCNDLCLGCGVCYAACPSEAISMTGVNGEFRPKINSKLCKNDRGCHRCYDSCPGLGVNITEGLTDKKYRYIGPYESSYVGYSNNHDIRYHGASGGIITGLLVWLLNNRLIDGVLETRFCTDKLYKVESFIAKSSEDILSSKSSKYSPVSLAYALKQLKQETGSRYIVVGLPCHIEGIRKLISKDKILNEKIFGLFSLYCSGTRTFNFTEYIFKDRRIDLNALDYLAYRDNGCLGGLVAKGKGIDYYEDYQSYVHPLRSIFYPRRCILCADHFGELADISFGDIHIPPYSKDKIGINSIIVRNSKWGSLLNQAAKDGAISLKAIDASEILKSQKMAYVKRSRNMSFCMILKKLGKIVPDFGSTFDGNITVKEIFNFIQIRIQQFIGRHRTLWKIIPLIKAKVKID